MIFVQASHRGFFSVKFKPTHKNKERIRQVPGARYDGNKLWIVPLACLDEFEYIFKGRFIYVTPRHELTGDPPPPLPKMYEKIPKKPVPNIVNATLYSYQEFGANFLACIAGGTGHALLTDKVGTGKTIQSIAAANIMQADGLADVVLVFCKASLKYQWQRDGVKAFTNDGSVVIDGKPKERMQQYQDARDPSVRFIIANYELLLNDLDEVMQLVKDRNIRLIIADEAHRITNHTGKMNGAMKKLVQENKRQKYKGVPYIFYLTATPMASKIEQLFGIFNIRRPDFFVNYQQFSKQYLELIVNRGRLEIESYLNLEELRLKVFPYMLRRTDEEIDMQLPEMVDINRRVKMTGLQYDLDEKAKAELESASEKVKNAAKAGASKDIVEQLEGSLKAMMYVRKAIANTPQLLVHSKSAMIQKKFADLVHASKEGKKSPKIEELKEIIEDAVIDSGEKLIIFTEFETMVRLLEQEIHGMGIDCVTYTGRHSSKEKDERVARFRDDPSCYIFIATDAAAEGLNLQFCPYMVNFDIPWNPDKWDQRKGRIQRGGSKYKSVKNINLIADESIDEAILNTLENKQNLFNFFVGNSEQQSEAIRRAMK